MAKIVVIGGTGYAGAAIVAEAAARGHEVVSLARNESADLPSGVSFVSGSIADIDSLLDNVGAADVVISAVAPRGETLELFRPALAELAAKLPEHTRLGVIGGAGGSLISEGGPRVIDVDFPDAFRSEAEAAITVLEDLQANDTELDWFYVHPAGGFGSFAPGERTGTYRTGGDVLVSDAEGNSYISAEDLAVAIIDEVEEPKHKRQRFTVGY